MKIICNNDTRFSLEFAKGARAEVATIDKSNIKRIKDENYTVCLTGMGRLKLIMLLEANGINYFFIDRGYVLDNGQKKWMRIAYNSFQMNKLSDYDKWRNNLRIAPEKWKKGGSYILIIPPCSKAGKYWGFDNEVWLERTITEIRKYSDRDILIRSRPPVIDRYDQNSLVSAASKAHIVVAYNSNAATEAIFAGTPALVLGESAAKFVSINDIKNIESPIRPDRTHWLKNIMYNQFTREEIMNGTALSILIKTHNLV